MNKLDLDYQNLLRDILDNGAIKETRNGGTISVFGRQIRHKMSEGYPLITTKKMAFKTMVTELLWFLSGSTNIKYLVENGCHIWDGDAYKNYDANYSDLKDGFVGIDLADPRNNEIRKFTKEEFINKIKTNDEFAKKWGELGPIYGKQWRSWGRKNVVNYDLENVKSSDRVKVMDLIRDGGDYSKYDVKVTYQNNSIDQITNLINDLKTNPDSRRLMVSAWNVGEIDQISELIKQLKVNPDSRRLLVSAWNASDLPHQVLPPCHYGFQVYTRPTTREEKIINPGKYRAISLMFNMRSTDVGLGLGFNLASYGLLLMMIAKQVNMVPDELIYSGGDVHLYLNHIDPIKEQLMREPYPLPTVKLSDKIVNDISEYTLDDIILENYKCHPPIKLPLSN